MFSRYFRSCWLLVLIGFLSQHGQASDYGTTGLIDVPDARFEDDGEFVASASTDGRHKQFSLTYQATPWLQTTFRYTGFNDFKHWDRNYEIKALLMRETNHFPQLALGLRDVVGTGLFGSEYVVATKEVGNLDITLGLAWGRLAGPGGFENPLTFLDSSFNSRDNDSGVGGTFAVGDLFSGPRANVVAGLKYSVPQQPISFLLEYNPDAYEYSYKRGRARPERNWSTGVTWHAYPGVDVRLSVQHGTDLGIGFVSRLNSKIEKESVSRSDFISSFYLSQKDLPRQINKNRWYDRLLFDVERSGLLLIEGHVNQELSVAQLVIGNTSFSLWQDAVSRHAALADLHLPATVHTIYFVVEENGHRSITIAVKRASVASSGKVQTDYGPRLLAGRSLKAPQFRTGFATGRINTELSVKTRFQLFDPDDPARYQVYASLSAEYALNNYWAVRSSLALDIDNNFDESRRLDSGSQLPKVRSDVARYLAEGDSGLDKLVLEGRNSLGRSTHYRLYGGYLDSMFAGVGVDMLYHPFKSRIAIGANIAFAKQRSFDRGLALRDYKVVTGHLSAYWATPFYNYDIGLHVGRYLAKDIGGTLEVRRTFRNGWQIGAWATLTNVPFEQFGEGSFDKGLFFRIPLGSIFGSSNGRNAFSAGLRPIQRDGGQRLDGFAGEIFWDLRAVRFDSFFND